MNKVLGPIWDEFIYGGHLLALGLVSIAALTSISINVNITWDFIAVVYLPTLSACLFGRYYGFKDDTLTNPKRYRFFEKKIRLIPLLIGSFLIISLIILIMLKKYNVLLFVIALLSLSLLYEVFFKKLTSKIVGFKNFFSAMIFSLVSVMLLLYYNIGYSSSFMSIFIFIFVMSFLATSYSDLKDVEGDKRNGLKTVAVVMGFDQFLLFLSVVSIATGIFIVLQVYTKALPLSALFLLFAILYNLLTFYWTRKKNMNIDFMVDVVSDAQFFIWFICALTGRAILK